MAEGCNTSLCVGGVGDFIPCDSIDNTCDATNIVGPPTCRSISQCQRKYTDLNNVIKHNCISFGKRVHQACVIYLHDDQVPAPLVIFDHLYPDECKRLAKKGHVANEAKVSFHCEHEIVEKLVYNEPDLRVYLKHTCTTMMQEIIKYDGMPSLATLENGSEDDAGQPNIRAQVPCEEQAQTKKIAISIKRREQKRKSTAKSCSKISTEEKEEDNGMPYFLTQDDESEDNTET